MSVTASHKLSLDLLRAVGIDTRDVTAVRFEARVNEPGRVQVERLVRDVNLDCIAESYLLTPEADDATEPA